MPSDRLGDTGDPSVNDRSAYMMFWTSNMGSSNVIFPYGWAFSMKLKDGRFVTPVFGAYPNVIGGDPVSMPGGSSAPQVGEVYQGDGLNVRCVRTN